VYAVDGLKSVILTLATAARVINISEAVNLSRLEEEYQVWILFSRLIFNEDININSLCSLLFMTIMIEICLLYIILFLYFSRTDLSLGQRWMASRVQQTRFTGAFISGDIICLFKFSFHHVTTQK